MKKPLLILLPALLVVALLLLTRTRTPPVDPVAAPGERQATGVVTRVEPVPAAASDSTALGETILRGYADPNLPPENDLTLMSRLMENSVLLLKAAANRPLSANEDWADFLLGRNAAREAFLPTNHVALNARGQLIDRWGTPLFFHALGGGRHEIRSAGPDRAFWTADDIQRDPNGSFIRPPGHQ